MRRTIIVQLRDHTDPSPAAGEALLAARTAAWAAALQSCLHQLRSGACAMFYCVSPQVWHSPAAVVPDPGDRKTNK